MKDVASLMRQLTQQQLIDILAEQGVLVKHKSMRSKKALVSLVEQLAEVSLAHGGTSPPPRPITHPRSRTTPDCAASSSAPPCAAACRTTSSAMTPSRHSLTALLDKFLTV